MFFAVTPLLGSPVSAWGGVSVLDPCSEWESDGSDMGHLMSSMFFPVVLLLFCF